MMLAQVGIGVFAAIPAAGNLSADPVSGASGPESVP